MSECGGRSSMITVDQYARNERKVGGVVGIYRDMAVNKVPFLAWSTIFFGRSYEVQWRVWLVVGGRSYQSR